MSVTLRLYDAAGSFQTALPLIGDVSVMDTLNEEGAATLSYYAQGMGAQALLGADDGSIGVHVDGKEVFQFLVEDDEDDEQDPAAGARTIRIGGQGTLAVLARGIVLPEDGIGAIPAVHEFKDATPGKIMRRLIGRMQDRGYLEHVTMSFTDTHDSSGAEWDVYVDISYDAGKDLLTVVKDLAAQGACDLKMVGRRLDLYRPNTTLAVDKPEIYVRRVHAKSASRKRSKRELRSDLLIVGDEGINMLKFDQGSRDRYGKRIGFVGQGNTISSATLDRIGSEQLKQTHRPTRGYTVVLRPLHKTCPKPYVDFRLGDSIRSDFIYSEEAGSADGGYEPLRVRSINTSYNQDGLVDVSVELNDRFLEAILDLARRVEGIRHGKIGTSSAPPSTTPGTDLTIPSTVSGINVRPKTSHSPEGIKSGTMHLSWEPVLTNNDATPADDIAHYEVRYRLIEEEVPPEEGTADPTDPPPPARTFDDQFTRPDSTSVGNGWLPTGGAWGLKSGSAVTSAEGAALLRDWGPGGVTIATMMSGAGTAAGPGVVARTTLTAGIRGGYFAQLVTGTTGPVNVTLRKNNVQVKAGRHGAAGVALPAGPHTISMAVNGQDITVVVNDVPVFTYQDTNAPPAGTYAGPASGGNNTQQVNFHYVTLTDPVAPVALTAASEDPQYVLAGTTEATSILLTGLPIRTRIIIEVRAVDRNGNPSEWFVTGELLTPMGDESPPDPTAPTLSTRLGGVVVQWDRLTADGGSTARDMAEVEVHAGATADFTLTSSTQVGSMIGGSAFIAGLEHGVPVWIRLRMRDWTGNYSDPSAAAQITPVPITTYLDPNQQVSGAQLTPGTVGSDKLVVGALSDGMLLNGGFEEVTDSGLPVGWAPSANPTYATGSTISVEQNLSKEGSRCLRIDVSPGTVGEAISLPHYPVSASTFYYLAAWMKGATDTVGQVGIYWYNSSKVQVGYTGAAPLALSGAWQQREQVLEVPADVAYARVAVRGVTPGATVFFDGVDLRRATGEAQILDASISRAKIANLAVGRAQIANAAVGDLQVGSVGVNKLIAGELTAEYVVVRGRLTSKSDQYGERWELDGQGFRSYDAAGTELANFAAGSATFSGTITAGASINSAKIIGGRIEGADIVGVTIEGALFRSSRFDSTGWDYIEIGNTGSSDPVDEIRFNNQGLWASLRNPSTDRGSLVISVSSGHTYLFGRRLDTRGASITTQGGAIHSDGGVHDSGYRVYSPRNPPPLPEHTHPRPEQAEYLSSRFTSPSGTYTIGLDGSGNTQIRYGGATRVAFTPSTTAKTFVIPHPRPDRAGEKFLQHAAVEGPTADVYYRGKGHLASDAEEGLSDYSRRVPRAEVILPDYFEDLTHVEGRTVDVTPIAGRCHVEGCHKFLPPSLAASDVVDGRFTVYAIAGFDHEHAGFYWEVKAVRKDVQPLEVEPSKKDYELHGEGPYTYLRRRGAAA